MIEVVRHDGRIEMQRVAFTGPHWRFVCSCGTRSALASKEQAELAQDRHAWEFHLADQEAAS